MRRRDPEANVGCVNWPIETCENTGEGGMWVYVFVLAEDREDEFVHCCGPATTISLPMPDVVTSDPGRVYEGAPSDPGDETSHAWCNAGRPVLAAACLGTSGGSWYDERFGRYWACAREDLTEAGRTLMDGLSALYGGAIVHLTTYLDT